MSLQRDITTSLQAISHLILDVDGTLTTGNVVYDSQKHETKSFSVRDGAALNIARSAGIKFIILTGRESVAVHMRATELGAETIAQGIKDKKTWLQKYMQEQNLCAENIAYIGDDVNDALAMPLAGFIACPCDACIEVLSLAHYVAPQKGGEGAVRDVIQFLLCLQGKWSKSVHSVFGLRQ